jgi:hypothetical protein
MKKKRINKTSAIFIKIAVGPIKKALAKSKTKNKKAESFPSSFLKPQALKRQVH